MKAQRWPLGILHFHFSLFSDFVLSHNSSDPPQIVIVSSQPTRQEVHIIRGDPLSCESKSAWKLKLLSLDEATLVALRAGCYITLSPIQQEN